MATLFQIYNFMAVSYLSNYSPNRSNGGGRYLWSWNLGSGSQHRQYWACGTNVWFWMIYPMFIQSPCERRRPRHHRANAAMWILPLHMWFLPHCASNTGITCCCRWLLSREKKFFVFFPGCLLEQLWAPFFGKFIESWSETSGLGGFSLVI